MKIFSGRASPTAFRDASTRLPPPPASSTFRPARNIQLIPYGLFRSFRDIDQRDPDHPAFESRTFKPDLGLDAKFILHGRFVLDATINPDFSQVESDQPQITVNQRFEVFFPEKRPFFLENSNFFTTPINLVFTRRIGHPEFGLRLTGKSGPWAVGVLASDDRAPGEALPPSDPHSGERATFTIARVSRDILEQSTIGAIFTDREFAGGHNRVAGIDANLKLDQNWRIQGAAVTSSTLNLDGSHSSGPGYKVDLERSGRKLNLQALYLDYSPGFVTETGFVNRIDIRQQNVNTLLLLPAGREVPDLLGTHPQAVQHLGPSREPRWSTSCIPVFAST